jgi:hypothetical protein
VPVYSGLPQVLERAVPPAARSASEHSKRNGSHANMACRPAYASKLRQRRFPQATITGIDSRRRRGVAQGRRSPQLTGTSRRSRSDRSCCRARKLASRKPIRRNSMGRCSARRSTARSPGCPSLDLLRLCRRRRRVVGCADTRPPCALRVQHGRVTASSQSNCRSPRPS